ncbi:MAG: PKD domain-containing protein [Bacteroidetes bacterium]|nr:PKD domain-containing protein [Bacteroidota bacterium]
MSENLNWLNNIRKAFDGFEPDVKGNWNSINRELDQLSNGATQQLDLLRRMKMARRVAIGATVVATSMTVWVATSSNYADLSDETVVTDSNEDVIYVEQHGQSEDVPSGKFQYDATQQGLLKGQPLALGDYGTSVSLNSDGISSFEKMGPTNSIVLSLSNEASNGNDGEANLGSPENGQRKLEHSANEDGASSSNAAATKIQGNRRENHKASSINSETSDGNKLERAETKKSEPDVSSNLSTAVSINASVQEACAGTEVSFILDGADENTSVLWNFGDGGFSQETAPSYVYEKPGTFDITVSVRIRGEGTIRTRTVENMIVVRPKPAADMRWELIKSDAKRASIKLIDETQNASSSVWMVEQRNTNASEVKLDIPGEYPVNLVASNAFGCQDIASEFVVLGSRKEAIAPALFSPNGDGRYDTFIPFIVMDFEGSWELTIWDEGEKIFSSKSSMDPWDGSFTNGSRAKVGKKYTWKLETRGLNGDVEYFIDEVLIDG